MAEFLPDEEELDEEVVEIEPYPIPRRVRTKRPWRAIVCTLLAIASVGVLFYGVATPIFDANEGARLSRIESLETQIEDAKLESNQIDDAADENIHNPKSVCDVIAKAQNDMLPIATVDTAGFDIEAAVAKAAKNEFPYMKGDSFDARPWVWLLDSSQPVSSLSWTCLTPLTFEGDEETVAWALMNGSTPYALATAVYDASSDVPQVSDVEITLTAVATDVLGDPPEDISALFSDAAWVKENSPRTSAIQSIQSSYEEATE